MDVRNFTPFVPIVYEHFDTDGNVFLPFIIKGTFDISQSGRLKISREQVPLVKQDVYYGSEGASSLRYEMDFVPYKPTTDIYFVEPIAFPPGGVASCSWGVQVRVRGVIDVNLRVYGQRKWQRTLTGWRISEPQPISKLPIRFDFAYGGTRGDRCYFQNPIGRGFGLSSYDDDFPAHQIEWADHTINSPNGDYEPASLTPIPKMWLPRSQYAGSYDQKWLDTKWPVMPDDFDFRFFNCAIPRLQSKSFLLGNEIFEIKGLSEFGAEKISLPNLVVFVLLRCTDGTLIPWTCNLDTIVWDLNSRKCWLTWRGKLPKLSFRVLEARVFENN